MEAGEAESTDCVDRHILSITPLSSSRRRSAFASHHQAQPLPQPRPTRTATEAWLGRKSSFTSTPNSSLRPSQACAAQKGCDIGGRSKLLRRLKKGSWRFLRCPRTPGVFTLEARPAAHLSGRVDTHPDELPRRSGYARPLLPCELLRGARPSSSARSSESLRMTLGG